MIYDFSQLNEAQAQAAKCIDGAVLVLAGAGSGKTRVLTHRIAYMLSLGISPYSVLAITFTNKAANEMKTRLSEMCPNAYGLTVCTIHSLCVRILRQEADKIGFTRDFSIYDEQDCDNVFKRIFARMDIEEDDIKKRIISNIRQAKTYFIPPEQIELITARNTDLTERVYREYIDTLRKSNAMDFDDLLNNCYVLLKNHLDVREKYQQRFRYISIDEFQDTNKTQFMIFCLLAETHGNLFVVGDDDQSIYGWRGAEIENILNFKNSFPNVQTFTLEQNYRSTKKILQAANCLISKNISRHEKTLFTDNDDGVRVETYTAEDEREEARYVVSLIATLYRQRDCSYGDFAILMRVNSLSRLFEQECLKYNIPVRIYGGFRFFERKEVKDMLSYLRIVNNRYDNSALLRIINVPKRGIGKSTVDALLQLSAEYGVCILDLISDERNLETLSSATQRKLMDFYALYAQIKQLSTQCDLVTFVERVVKMTEYKQYLLQDQDGYERELNIDQLIASVEEFVKENGQEVTLSDYLQTVSLNVEYNEQTQESDCVTISTVHSAKGLEFDNVFIVGMDDGIFPLSRASLSIKESEEERRLAYVAVTRAKKRLYLTHARTRFLYGDRQRGLPSPFFKEVSALYQKTQRVTYDIDGVPSHVPQPTTVYKPSVKSNFADFKPSTIVNHKVFGRGIILAISGENATVAFETVGKKELALKYAPLEKVK